MTTKLEAAARQALEALLAATPVKAKDPQLQADAIVALREALAEQQAAEPVEHCEAGPEYCPQCLSESKPTYGSEEVRKLKEVIESQAKIIALMEKERVCPPFWPVVQHLLDEYGLQLIDIVAAYKQATEQPAQEPVAWANPNDLQNFDMKVRTNGGPLHTVPLYTHPAPTQQDGTNGVVALQERLRQAAEPVAWMTHSHDLQPLFHKTRAAALNWQTEPTPLYKHPKPQTWAGLDQHDIDVLFLNEDGVRFARYIEAKLKEKNT